MRSLIYVLILATTTLGCNSRKANEADPASDQSATDHRGTNDVPRTTGDHAADDKATEDLQAKQAEEAKKVDAKAAVDAEAVKAHAAMLTQLQATFDASARRFNELNEKVSKLSATKKNEADRLAAEVKANEATVMASIAKLRDATLPQWDAAKAKVDTDTTTFNKSIDALELATRT
ncbi:MAG: hypothetical protein IPQ07_38670 [Myxococcales bacterium]|nr:hypothetical protein [Myxococcales bacterium]